MLRYLQALATNARADITPADDLESLVKMCYYLAHPQAHQPLAAAGRQDYAAIDQLWQQWFARRPQWSGVLHATASKDYAAVKSGLARLLE